MRTGRTMLCMIVLVLVLCQCSFATLLFKTGFESGTAIGARRSSAVCPMSGTDNSTGYTWPINLGSYMDPNLTGAQCLTGGSPWTDYMEPTIETVTGHLGTSTKVMHFNSKQKASGSDQLNFMLGFSSEPTTGLYYKYWVKYDTNVVPNARSGGFRNVWEMKSCLPYDNPEKHNCTVDLDSRVIAQIGKDGSTGEACWAFAYDHYATPPTDGEYSSIAMTAGEIDKLLNGQWLLMEFYFYRNPNHTSNGRFLWKVDGRTIVNRQDRTFWGAYSKEQVFHIPFTTYSAYAPIEIWVDDLEIHDSIPNDQHALNAGPASVAARKATTMSSVASGNTVPNPGFETTINGQAAEWRTGAPRQELAPAILPDTQYARTGERSLCMSGVGTAGVVGWASASYPGVEGGKVYELAVYLRAEEVPSLHESAWVKLTWLRADREEAPWVTYLHSLEPEGEWWRCSGVVRAPEGATSAEITLGIRYAPQGMIWWDDVSLREIPAPAPRRVRLATVLIPGEKRTDPKAWRELIVQAGEGKADVVCLGEMTQIVHVSPKQGLPIPGPATDALGELAKRYRMMIVASLPEKQGSLLFNTAVIIGRNGELIGRYRKTHLPEAEVEEGYTPGSDIPVFDTDIGRVGLQICYDHFFPEVSRALALQGAEIIFTPIWGDERSNRKAYEAVARARAIDNSVYYVTCIYSRRSLIIDPSGTILADTVGEPGVVFADVDLDAAHYEPWMVGAGAAEFRYLYPKERRPSLYGPLSGCCQRRL